MVVTEVHALGASMAARRRWFEARYPYRTEFDQVRSGSAVVVQDLRSHQEAGTNDPLNTDLNSSQGGDVMAAADVSENGSNDDDDPARVVAVDPESALVWGSDYNLRRLVVQDWQFAFERADPRPPNYWTSRYNRGERIDPAEFPEVLHDNWKQGGKEPPKDLPGIFMGTGGVKIVTEEVKSLLEQFNLGQTHFVPVKLITRFKKEVEGKFFYLNIAELRRVIDPEESATITRNRGGNAWMFNRQTFTESGDLSRETDFAVTGLPPDSIDLWMDPLIKGSIFATARLAKALNALDTGEFALFPCRTV